MPDKDNRKDFELAIREVIDGYRKDGVNYNQENLAMALETQAALLRRDDTWGFDSEAAREERKRQGIQEPRPTEAEMKHALTAQQALEGGKNLGLETDVKAPKSQEDMEPIPLEDRPPMQPEQRTGEDPGLQPTTGKSNKQKKAEEDAARR
jgi:hypothetical protein